MFAGLDPEPFPGGGFPGPVEGGEQAREGGLEILVGAQFLVEFELAEDGVVQALLQAQALLAEVGQRGQGG